CRFPVRFILGPPFDYPPTAFHGSLGCYQDRHAAWERSRHDEHLPSIGREPKRRADWRLYWGYSSFSCSLLVIIPTASPHAVAALPRHQFTTARTALAGTLLMTRRKTPRRC